MSHSNSSLNCFTQCMKKYELNYIEHCKPEKISPHLTFGIMAHECLYQAGQLRDAAADGVIHPGEYMRVIPSEVDCHDLKQEFGIHSWQRYFSAVIKQVAEYERGLTKEILAESPGETLQIFRELKLQLTVDQLAEHGIYGLTQPLVGVIDLLLLTKTHAYIVDYKFSSSRKTQDDFDQNSQLPLYAMFVHFLYDIPLHNIKYGYIDIPKQEFELPAVLKNGTLSKAKSQNCSQEMYKAAVDAVHEGDPYYNCEEGGYYYETWCALALNKAAYLSMQWLDLDTYSNITHDLVNTAYLIDTMTTMHLPFIRKYDSYSCRGCEYKEHCKTWLGVNW